MTDTPTTETAATDTAGAESSAAEPDTGGGRAAGYRQRARVAEDTASWLVAERDQQLTGLRQQVEAFQRADVERIAATHIRDGADLWSTGVTLDELLGDDGRVAAEKVSELAQDLAVEKPHWRRPGATETTSSVTGNDRVGVGKAAPSFADAFKPK